MQKNISFALLLVPSVRDKLKVLSQDVWLPYSSPTFVCIITQSNTSFKQGHLSRDIKSRLCFWIFLALPTKTLCDLSVLGDVHCTFKKKKKKGKDPKVQCFFFFSLLGYKCLIVKSFSLLVASNSALHLLTSTELRSSRDVQTKLFSLTYWDVTVLPILPKSN